jgi:hypothetical protein
MKLINIHNKLKFEEFLFIKNNYKIPSFPDYFLTLIDNLDIFYTIQEWDTGGLYILYIWESNNKIYCTKDNWVFDNKYNYDNFIDNTVYYFNHIPFLCNIIDNFYYKFSLVS